MICGYCCDCGYVCDKLCYVLDVYYDFKYEEGQCIKLCFRCCFNEY